MAILKVLSNSQQGDVVIMMIIKEENTCIYLRTFIECYLACANTTLMIHFEHFCSPFNSESPSAWFLAGLLINRKEIVVFRNESEINLHYHWLVRQNSRIYLDDSVHRCKFWTGCYFNVDMKTYVNVAIYFMQTRQ